MHRTYLAVFFVVLVFLLASQSVIADSSNVPWKVTIRRDGHAGNSTVFWPSEVQARKGDTITWTNNDTSTHTITSGVTDHMNYSGKVFDSGLLNPGQSYSFKIPSDIWSAYYYFCKIHPWMTGKIDVGDAYLGKSPIFTVTTDKDSYSNGDVMSISGAVSDTTQITPISIQIFDSQRNLVYSSSTNLTSSHGFQYNLKTSDGIFKNAGDYKIKVFYGFPSTVTDVNFFFNNQTQDSASHDNYKIPYWLKNNARWWSQGQISDKDFIKGIQFLISNGELKTSDMDHQATKTGVIPSWIRSNAGWWAGGIMSDDDFISSIQYLIDHNIINI